MHETGIVKSLIHEVERIARQYGEHEPQAWAVKSVRVQLGALCPFSEGHMRDHFIYEAKGTVAERAKLVVGHGTDPTDPLAQDVTLLSIDVEEILPGAVRAANVSARRRT